MSTSDAWQDEMNIKGGLVEFKDGKERRLGILTSKIIHEDKYFLIDETVRTARALRMLTPRRVRSFASARTTSRSSGQLRTACLAFLICTPYARTQHSSCRL